MREICDGYAGVTKFGILQDLLEFVLMGRIFAVISVGADDKGEVRALLEVKFERANSTRVNTVSVSESQQQQISCDLQHSPMRIATECPDPIYLAEIPVKTFGDRARIPALTLLLRYQRYDR